MAMKTKSSSRRKKGKDSWSPSYGSLEASVWDSLKAMKKENRQLRYKAVEDVMAPLINQVTSLTEYKLEDSQVTGENEALRHLGAAGRWLGRPQKLVQLVDKAVMNLLADAEDIANENPDFKTDMTVACEDVRSKGETVHGAAVEFVVDTMSPERRVVMVSASRDLLLAVTRLLVIVDMIDVNKILTLSSRIEKKLQLMCSSRDESEVAMLAQECSDDISFITQVATLYPNKIDTKASLQLLTSVQTDLQKSSRMLASASKVFLQFPSEKAAEENREEVRDRMMKSLQALSLLTSGEDPGNIEAGAEVGRLSATFTSMETRLLEVINYNPSKLGMASLQEHLEVALRGAAELANSVSTRDYRQRSILTKSSSLKSELSSLLSILRDVRSEDGEKLSDQVKAKAKESASLCRRHLKALHKELQGVCVDHISDAFVALWDPVNDLVEVAHKGRRGRVEQCAEALDEHSARLLKAGSLSCLLSNDVKHIKEVTSVSSHVSGLTSQVIRAAQTLVAQPSSTTLQKNVTIFKESWMEKVTQLTRCVDAMTPLIDFLTITEAHICGDGIALLQSMSSGEEASFLRSARLVRERCSRLGHMVRVEMRRNPGRYSAGHKKKIKRCMEELDNNVVAFKEHSEKLSFELADASSNCSLVTNATEKVVEMVRKLRQKVLEAMSPEDQERSGVLDLVDTMSPLLSLSLSQLSVPGTPEIVEIPEVTGTPEVEVAGPPGVAGTPEVEGTEVAKTPEVAKTSEVAGTPQLAAPKKFQRTPRHSDVFETDESSQNAMASLSPEQRTQLAKATAGLSAQQKEFESAVKQWDAENDMVVLAKEMCMMVMDMSDFTRNLGPLKSMMDLIITSKDIARAGEYICSMASKISAQCPDDKSKSDLQADVDRMKLYCHQLKITSSVRADSKSSNQRVDNASALITAARNALNAAVELVRMSYIASRAISRVHKGTSADQFSMWRLTLPKMKDLEKGETQKNTRDAPIHRLGQFKPGKHRQAPFV